MTSGVDRETFATNDEVVLVDHERVPLVYDKRAELAGGPGLHALIVGVSDYPHLPLGAGTPAPNSFGMEQLSSPALSGYRIAEWLIARHDRFRVPLATVRLLVAPAAEEVDVESALATVTQTCSLQDAQREAKAWRSDAAEHRDGMTFFYFGGHGVQRTKGDGVLLLQDFGDDQGGALGKAINARNVYYGMSPSKDFPEIARTQVYFCDACRIESPDFKDYEQMDTATVWDVRLDETKDDRSAPIYFATVPGGTAYGRAAMTTVFAQSLLDCLDGGAGDRDDASGGDEWRVTNLGLSGKLGLRVAELANEEGGAQWVVADGIGSNVVLHYLDEPPPVQVELEVIPSEAVTCVKVTASEGPSKAPCVLPMPPGDELATLPAGVYSFSAVIQPPTDPYQDVHMDARPVLPFRVKRTFNV